MHQCINQAFTLIELSVYMALMSIFCFLLYLFAWYVFDTMQVGIAVYGKSYEAQTILQLMIKDLMSASKNIYHWDTKEMIFLKQNSDLYGSPVLLCVQWKFIDVKRGSRSCMRVSYGEFDFLQHHWKTKQVSLLPCPFSALTMQLEYNSIGDVSGVFIRYRLYNDKEEKKLYTALRNKEFL